MTPDHTVGVKIAASPAKFRSLPVGIAGLISFLLFSFSFAYDGFGIQPHRYTFGGRFRDFDRSIASPLNNPQFDRLVMQAVRDSASNRLFLPRGYIGSGADTHTTQFGLQAALLAIVYPRGAQPDSFADNYFYFSSAWAAGILSAAIAAIFVACLALHFGLPTALPVMVLIAWSDWFVIHSRSLYWCEFSLLLPFTLGWLLYPLVIGGRLSRAAFLAAIAAAVALRCALSTYEFVFDAVLGASVPIVYFECLERTRLRHIIVRAAQSAVAGGAALLAVMTLHLVALRYYVGSLHAAAQNLFSSAIDRSVLAFEPEPADQFGRLPVWAQHLPITFLKLAAYLWNSVITVSLPHWGSVHIYLAAAALVQVLVTIGWAADFKGLRSNGSPLAALTAATVWSFLVPVAWLAAFPGHFTPHLHFATVNFYVPWLFTLYVWIAAVRRRSFE